MATSLFGRLKVPTVAVNTQKTFTVYGRSFIKVTNVYLSGVPLRNTTFINPFSSVPRLSAIYTGFRGIRLEPGSYSVNGNTITFTVPQMTKTGYVDIIVENEAGYGALTQHAIKVTPNPYAVNSTDYRNFVSYKRPWSSGILVTKLSSTIPADLLNQTYTIELDKLFTIEGDNLVTIE
jgi:hypothetical protein